MPFQIKRGTLAGSPTLAEGELGYTTDEKALYVGNISGGNTRIGPAEVGNTDVRVRLTGALTPTNNTDTTISWDDDTFQHAALWATSPNPTRLVAPVDGRYLVICEAPTNVASQVDSVDLSILVNGNASDGTSAQYGHDTAWTTTTRGGSGSSTLFPRVVALLDLAATDYVEFSVFITDGHSGTSNLQSQNTWASMALV